jgi:hypothetical protein
MGHTHIFGVSLPYNRTTITSHGDLTRVKRVIKVTGMPLQFVILLYTRMSMFNRLRGKS